MFNTILQLQKLKVQAFLLHFKYFEYFQGARANR